MYAIALACTALQCARAWSIALVLATAYLSSATYRISSYTFRSNRRLRAWCPHLILLQPRSDVRPKYEANTRGVCSQLTATATAAPSPVAAAVAAAAARSSKSLYHNYSSSTRDPCWKLDTHTISRDFAQLQLHILSSSRYSRPMHALQVSSPSLGNIHIILDRFEWMKTSSNFIDDVFFFKLIVEAIVNVYFWNHFLPWKTTKWRHTRGILL